MFGLSLIHSLSRGLMPGRSLDRTLCVKCNTRLIFNHSHYLPMAFCLSFHVFSCLNCNSLLSDFTRNFLTSSKRNDVLSWGAIWAKPTSVLFGGNHPIYPLIIWANIIVAKYQLLVRILFNFSCCCWHFWHRQLPHPPPSPRWMGHCWSQVGAGIGLSEGFFAITARVVDIASVAIKGIPGGARGAKWGWVVLSTRWWRLDGWQRRR